MTRVFAFTVIIILFLSSCTFWQTREQDPVKAIAGNWLILYPEHELTTADQRKAYTKAQDSIVSLLGLKTISFLEGGTFFQSDSIFKPAGNWHFNPENKNLFIRNAGKGLDFFKGTFSGIRRDTMQVVETIVIDGEEIKLTWFLKRIADKRRSTLFTTAGNWWRKTVAIENNEQLKTRMKALLDYYSLYYEMVSKESAYFSQSRVFLPLRYYQHSMELKPFSETSSFSQLFKSPQQARDAYHMLLTAFEKSNREKFPAGQDFVIEYSMFIKRLAASIQ